MPVRSPPVEPTATLAAAVVVVVAAASCAAPGAKGAAFTPEPAPDLGPVVARVGETMIFASDVRNQAVRLKLTSRAALEDLVRFHLLAEKARTQGLWDEAVRAGPPPALLVERFIEREFEPRARPEDIPTEEVRQLYERNIDQFVHPRLVKVAVLSTYTGERMKPEGRARAREAAAALWKYLQSRTDKATLDLKALAREPVWSERRVVFGELWQATDKPFGPKVGAAVQRLTKPGELTPLVEDETGLHISRYIEERPAVNLTFAAAQDELRNRYHARWREKAFLDFARALQDAHKVEVHASRPSAPGPTAR